MFKPIDTLLQRIEALEKEVQKLKDDQIKQNRDYKDAMYNLDTDNIPALQGVVKKVNLIISEGGTVTAQFVMEVINNESNAKIKADRINLEGLVLNLTANNITISSDNFSVDKNGHVVMGSADINRGCVLGSDIEQGTAMRIGPAYQDDNCSSNASLQSLQKEDGVSGGYTRGLAFSSALIRGSKVAIDPDDVKAITGDICADAKRTGAKMGATTVQSPVVKEKAFVGLERSDTSMPSDDFIIAKMQVGNHALWIDANGNLCTTATMLKVGQQIL